MVNLKQLHLPTTWSISTVGREFDIALGKMLDSARNTGVLRRYIGNRAVQWGYVDLAESLMVRLTSSDLHRYRLKRGDLLVCEGGEVGRAAIWNSDQECYYQKALHRLRPRNGYSTGLMQAYLQFWSVSDFLKLFVSQTSIAHLTKETLAQIPLPVPTPAEQRAIATALSDMDALIAAQEKLIAKKRNIKTATMQQLLTGRKRLAGFGERAGYINGELGRMPNDWSAPEMREILDSAVLGGNYRNAPDASSRPLIKMGNIERGQIATERLEYIPDGQKVSEEHLLRRGDVLFNTRNTLDLVGKVAIWRNELPRAYFNSNLLRLDFMQSRVSNNFFACYALNSRYCTLQLKGIATGTTSVGAIYTRDLMKVRLLLPTPPEQEAIAEVLSDMDAEITALEARLAKLRDIKQGMMQELLTGRTRLV